MDVESVVNLLAKHNLIRPNRIIGDYYSCYCPIHSGGQERKPSFGILMHRQVKNGTVYPEGWCHCFACNLNVSLLQLVETIFSTTAVSQSVQNEIYSQIRETSEIDEDTLLPMNLVDELQSKLAINYISSKLSKKQEYVSEEELASYRYTVPYMYERGLTDDIIEKYDIGVDLKFIPPGRKNPVPCITFPVRDMNGNVLFIARRSIEDKYFFLPSGIDKPVYGLYESPDNCKSIVIVESVFNLTSCVKYGYPAVALFGTGTSNQIKQLRQLGVSDYVLGLDGDEAGNRGAAKLKRALRDCGLVWTMPIPDGKDINDLTEDEFFDAYNSRM